MTRDDVSDQTLVEVPGEIVGFRNRILLETKLGRFKLVDKTSSDSQKLREVAGCYDESREGWKCS
jgi:hypothetical protein